MKTLEFQWIRLFLAFFKVRNKVRNTLDDSGQVGKPTPTPTGSNRSDRNGTERIGIYRRASEHIGIKRGSLEHPNKSESIGEYRNKSERAEMVAMHRSKPGSIRIYRNISERIRISEHPSISERYKMVRGHSTN